MYDSKGIKRDRDLKQYISEDRHESPAFEWGTLLNRRSKKESFLKKLSEREVMIVEYDREDVFDFKRVATSIGKAITNLNMALLRDPDTIFTAVNQEFVCRVTEEVVHRLQKLETSRASREGVLEKDVLRIHMNDLNRLIEKTLVDFNAYDVAKSFVLDQAFKRKEQQEPFKVNVKVIRRNNHVVSWNASKIEVAVRKAFLSLEIDSSPAVDIVEAVSTVIQNRHNGYVHIEDIQNIIQEELMKAGHYKVAEAYIIYRNARTIQRQNELQKQEALASESVQQLKMVMVTRHDGSAYMWDGRDLRERIAYASLGLDVHMSQDAIETELRRSIYENITEADLKRTVILNAKALIERDADFCLFSGRILLSYVYEEVLDWSIVRDGISKLRLKHERYFKRYLSRGIEIGMLDAEVVNSYRKERLAKVLDPTADMDFDYLGIQTLYDRYLLVDKTQKFPRRIETPQIFWMRVAMGLFYRETKKREDLVIQLYSLYKSRLFCSSTPTLFNAATLHSQLSSCYVYWVGDSLKSIMQRGIADNAYLSKWAGGLGGSWTSVRGSGSFIQGTNGESQGVIPFLKLHNDQLVAVNQGGKRRGSGCVYLEVWHNDFMEFLELKRNTGDERRRTHDMNTASWIPDLFMKRVEAREHWTFFRSNEASKLHEIYGKDFEKEYLLCEDKARKGQIYSRSMPAIEVWKKMLQMLFETAHPWITFKDPCNIANPQDHKGVIHSSNLCTEIVLNTNKDETAVCNLGSVVIENHLDENGKLDHKKLRNTIRIAVRALDNVIDINFYPVSAAKRSNEKHRPIGLGIMGLQNALYQKNISFASKEAIDFNDELLEAISYYAIDASSDLAREKGAYPSYKGSKWSRGIFPQDSAKALQQERGLSLEIPLDKASMNWTSLKAKVDKQGMRNCNVLAIAPTATISNIMRTTPCIEPAYKNLFVKSNLSGDFIVLNAWLVKDLKKEGLWNQDMLDNLKYFDGELEDITLIPEKIKTKYMTAFSIDYNFIIEAAARRQKWIDQSQSVNLWLKKPNMKILSHMYRAAWKKGLKTTYYLRTLGASNIEKATVDLKKQQEDIHSPLRKPLHEDPPKPTIAIDQACTLQDGSPDDECEVCQ